MNTSFPWQLQRQFEQAISTGEYPKGKILTLDELVARFEATGDDVLRVMLAEQRKGLVAQHETGFELLGLGTPGIDSLFVHTSKSGMQPSTEVRAAEIEPATPLVAEKLDVEVGSPVYRYERTRYVNGEALANQVNYIPFEVCPGLENDDVSRTSFQRLLEGKYMAVPARVDEEIRIVPASEKDREILDLPVGASVLVVQRVVWSVTERPLVWADIHIRTDRYQYVAELWPSAASLLSRGTA